MDLIDQVFQALVVDADERVVLVVFLVERLISTLVMLDPVFEVLHRFVLIHADVIGTVDLHFLQCSSNIDDIQPLS